MDRQNVCWCLNYIYWGKYFYTCMQNKKCKKKIFVQIHFFVLQQFSPSWMLRLNLTTSLSLHIDAYKRAVVTQWGRRSKLKSLMQRGAPETHGHGQVEFWGMIQSQQSHSGRQTCWWEGPNMNQRGTLYSYKAGGGAQQRQDHRCQDFTSAKLPSEVFTNDMQTWRCLPSPATTLPRHLVTSVAFWQVDILVPLNWPFMRSGHNSVKRRSLYLEETITRVWCYCHVRLIVFRSLKPPEVTMWKQGLPWWNDD